MKIPIVLSVLSDDGISEIVISLCWGLCWVLLGSKSSESFRELTEEKEEEEDSKDCSL